MRPDRFAPERLVGQIVGERYRLLQLLSSGGTGHVYSAERVAAPSRAGSGEARERVAVKVLRAEHRGRRDLVARFEREATAAARIQHPNVLAVLEGPFGAASGRAFAMELLRGLDLADTLAFARKLSPSRAVGIALGAAEGLAAAHAAGVIHRDVKPENLFLVHAPDGREQVKLLDFGFSHLPEDPAEAPGRVVGTPEYLAPEQAGGAPAHPSADIYSLGIVLYEMLAGRVPFTGPYPAIAHRHAAEAVPPLALEDPGVLPELEAVVQRALAKHPADRFPTMADMKAALLDLLSGGYVFALGPVPC